MKYAQLGDPIKPATDFGKDFALVFDYGHIHSQTYGDAQLAGYFICSQPYGHHPAWDLDACAAADSSLMLWSHAMGMTLPGDKFYKSNRSGLSGIVLLPDLPPESTVLLGKIIFFFVTFDDAFTKTPSGTPPPSLGELEKTVNLFIDALEGRITDPESLPDPHFPRLGAFCKALASMREDVLALPYPHPHYFFDDFANFLRSLIWEVEYTRKGAMTKEEYFWMRRWTIFTSPALELMLILKGLVLPPAIRSHPLYLKYYELPCLQVILVNDLVSRRREIESDELSNSVILRARRGSLQSAIRKGIKKVNEATRLFNEIGAKLLATFPGDGILAGVVTTYRRFWDGHLYWCEATRRYSGQDGGYQRVRVDLGSYSETLATYVPLQENTVGSTGQGIISLIGKKPGPQITRGCHVLESCCSPSSGYQAVIGATPCLKNERSLSPQMEVLSSALALDMFTEYGIPVNPWVLRSLSTFLRKQYTDGLSNFFVDRSLLPDDVDDTSLVTLALYKNRTICLQKVAKVAARIAGNTDGNGIIQTYFPPRPSRQDRIDLVVSTQALRIAYISGQDELVRGTEDFVLNCLSSEKEWGDFLYFYFSPDAFLFFCTEAVKHSDRAWKRFNPVLRRVLGQRLQIHGKDSSSLEISMRILAANNLRCLADNKQIFLDWVKLLEIRQRGDGSWAKEAMYKAGRSELYFGGGALPTVFALCAVKVVERGCANLGETKPPVNNY